MRAVWKEEDLQKAWESARQEASASFGNDGCTWKNLLKNHVILKFRLWRFKGKAVTYPNAIVLYKEDIQN